MWIASFLSSQSVGSDKYVFPGGKNFKNDMKQARWIIDPLLSKLGKV